MRAAFTSSHRLAIRPGLVALLLIPVVLAACGSGATPTASSSPFSSADSRMATTLPSASATPKPTAWGPAVHVTGWEVCFAGPGPIIKEPDGIASHERGGGVGCTDTANDPRVSGNVSGSFDSDAWGEDWSLGVIVEWGTIRLENSGGAWEGTWSGVYTAETGDMITNWYTGTGAYAGLSYYQFVHAPPGTVASGIQYDGVIFPGGLPPRPLPSGLGSPSPSQ